MSDTRPSAAELIEAASRLLGRVGGLDARWFNIAPRADARLLATHTIATVRADDDESVSVDWYRSVGVVFRPGMAEIGPLYAEVIVLPKPHVDMSVSNRVWREGDTELAMNNWEIKQSTLRLPATRTRREFRDLCRTLGITLTQEKAGAS